MKPPNWVTRLTRSTALNGPDDWPSFAKLVTLLVIFVPLPMGTAMTVVASAHGTKVLLALINAKTVRATESIETHIDVWARRDTESSYEPSR